MRTNTDQYKALDINCVPLLVRVSSPYPLSQGWRLGVIRGGGHRNIASYLLTITLLSRLRFDPTLVLSADTIIKARHIEILVWKLKALQEGCHKKTNKIG